MTNTGIECFLAICRYKTASAAARSLYITQPSLSARLKVLEEEVGVPLFYRNKGSREMTLTGTGKEFYRLAVQYEELISKMKALGDVKKTTLRISCFSSLDTYFLPAVYRLFAQKCPQFNLQMLDVGDSAPSQYLLQGETDLAFSTNHVFNSQLQRIPIFSEPMVLICAAGFQVSEPVVLTDLPPLKEVFVKWGYDFLYWYQKVFGNPQTPLYISSMVQLKQYLEQEQGWAFVPVSVAKGLAAEGNIRQLKTDTPLPHREISCVINPQKQLPSLEPFLDCLLQVMKEYPEFDILLQQ